MADPKTNPNGAGSHMNAHAEAYPWIPFYVNAQKEGDEMEIGKLNLLDERLKAIEGANCPDSKNAFEMCLVPDVILPPKFKVPEFEKYNGTTCPKIHLHMYVRKMSAYHTDDKLLIHCFQDSLAGMAMNWYMRLERDQIKTFKDLSNAFTQQYKYNEDVAPTRSQLQGLSKRQSESFKEYAQRWRGLASQVLPRMEEEEQILMFINTLQNPYYSHLVGCTTSGFNDLIKAGGMVENGIKSGKIQNEQTSVEKKPSFIEKEEGETYFVTNQSKGCQRLTPNLNYQNPNPHTQIQYQPVYPSIAYIDNQNYVPPQFIQPLMTPYQTHPYQPSPNTSQTPYLPSNTHQHHPPHPYPQPYYPNTHSQGGQPRKRGRKRFHYDPIPMTYSELLPQLLQRSLITPLPWKNVEPPYSAGFDLNSHCDYHGGSIGHSTNDCNQLKGKVRELIDAGLVRFQGNILV